MLRKFERFPRWQSKEVDFYWNLEKLLLNGNYCNCVTFFFFFAYVLFDLFNFVYVSAIKVAWKGHLYPWLSVCKGTKYRPVMSQESIAKVCCLKLILYLGCIRSLLVRRSWDSLILNIKNKIKYWIALHVFLPQGNNFWSKEVPGNRQFPVGF